MDGGQIQTWGNFVHTACGKQSLNELSLDSNSVVHRDLWEANWKGTCGARFPSRRWHPGYLTSYSIIHTGS